MRRLSILTGAATMRDMEIEPRNPHLRTALESWLPAALPHLRREFDAHPFGTDDQLLQSTRLALAVVHPDLPIRHLGETTSLLNAMGAIPELTEDTIGPLTTANRRIDFPSIYGAVTLSHFLQAYYSEVLDWAFDSVAFATIYADLEAYIHDIEPINIRTLIEVWNVRSESPAIIIAPGITLRHLSDKEKTQSIKESIETERFRRDPTNPDVPEVLLEIQSQAGDLLSGSGNKAADIQGGLTFQTLAAARSVLLGLRLIGAGDIILGMATTCSENRLLPSSKNIGLSVGSVPGSLGNLSWASSWIPAPRTPPYFVSDNAATQLVGLWSLLESTPSDRRLALALRRFEMSYAREDAEDQIIDYWIALEALFLPDGNQELVYRASLRIARFLGRYAQERLDLFNTVKNSYNLRSKVAHGAELRSQDRLDSVTNETGESLRRALCHCLMQGAPPSVEDLHVQLLD